MLLWVWRLERCDVSVHILKHGLALCGAGMPSAWPGDRWISFLDTKIEADAPCSACRSAHPLATTTAPTWWRDDGDGRLYLSSEPPPEPEYVPLPTFNCRCVVTPVLTVQSCACVSIDPDTCARVRHNRPGITGRRIDDDTERDPCDCACHDDADEPDDLSDPDILS